MVFKTCSYGVLRRVRTFSILRRSVYNSVGKSQMTSINNKYLEISEEVLEAKARNRPIVALESTIITHGLPFPTNLQTAFEIENEIRKFDVVPATIALLNGKLKVGLTKAELEYVAKSHESAVKLSRRDLTYAFALSTTDAVGGTTVSTTMMAAHSAGIPIFVTGGIGGVHRDVNDSMDVSADLQELARTPVAVISSGVKSILDIGKTLEYLETMGVCVYTLDSQGSREFPSFFTSKSGLDSPYNLLNEQQAAKVIGTHLDLGLSSGLLIGVPIPAEHSADHVLIESAIQEALKEAAKLKIHGKKVTPFLLEKINQITKGQSLKSNIELIKNNARVGARIALELSKRHTSSSSPTGNDHITVIGGVNLDNTYKLLDEKTVGLKGVTQPSQFNQSLGGVGRNMAEALLRLNSGHSKVQFITAVADDLAGRFICHESNSMGLDSSKWLIVENKDSSHESIATGSYCAIFEKSGELMLGLGDMRSHDHISVEHIKKHLTLIKDSRMCVIDADLSVETIEYLCNVCHAENIPVWFNPTDLRKCDKIIKANALGKITFMSPNLKELIKLFKSLMSRGSDDCEAEGRHVYEKLKSKDEDKIELADGDLQIVLKTLLKTIPFIVLSRGSDDLLLASAIDLPTNDESSTNLLPASKQSLINFKKNFKWCPTLVSYPVIQLEKNEKLMNVSGAGDSTTSGIISGLLKGYTLTQSVYNGLLAGKYALLTHKNVSSSLESISLDQLKSIISSKQKQIKKIHI